MTPHRAPRTARSGPRPAILILVAVLAAAAVAPRGAVAQEAPPLTPAGPCEGKDYAALDFWIGSWEVLVQETKVGTNRIEKILGGCAILEHWSDARGREGKSFFYRDPVAALWKQVWVTGSGSIKEKSLATRRDDGGVVFRGEIPRIDGGVFLDRTTLTPMTGGRVRQVIEQSSDGGATWNVTFDAVYVRAVAASTP